MKTRTSRNSVLYIIVIVTAALATAPLATYAKDGAATIYSAEVPGDNSDNDSVVTDAETIITDGEAAGSDETEAAVSNDDTMAENSNTQDAVENSDTQEAVENSDTQDGTDEVAAPEQEEAATADEQISTVRLSGLTILNSNWDHVTAYVANTETGEVQKISMSYRDENTLEGSLTDDSGIDANGAYKIEAWIFGADGGVYIVDGTMTDSDDSDAITFTANSSLTI